MRDHKQLKRKRKSVLGAEPEIERQLSDPADLSQNYESIRRRSNNLPSSTSLEKINRSYGSMIPDKRSSLIPLVEDDV